MITEARKMGFTIINLDAEEAASHQNLTEETHFDPFDRMLIWQAIQRKMTLISADGAFRKFVSDGLELLWE